MSRMDKLSNYKTVWNQTDLGGSVIYTKTAIVKWDKKTIQLNSYGWESVTTKRKMNQASNQFNLNYTVFQKNFDWFVTQPNGETIPYFDNMIIFREDA
tara:strand:+ start:431 stop:724 length:294 start_codon:yes stop_codon:yes gene_type:complete